MKEDPLWLKLLKPLLKLPLTLSGHESFVTVRDPLEPISFEVVWCQVSQKCGALDARPCRCEDVNDWSPSSGGLQNVPYIAREEDMLGVKGLC